MRITNQKLEQLLVYEDEELLVVVCLAAHVSNG